MAALLAACGGSTDGSGSATANRVELERSRFVPVEVTVEAGSSVEFVNLDPFDHTVTSRDDSPLQFDSGILGADEVFTQQFAETGTFAYFCKIHPTMRATVVVV